LKSNYCGKYEFWVDCDHDNAPKCLLLTSADLWEVSCRWRRPAFLSMSTKWGNGCLRKRV
jgi:hypothetical protein